MYGSYLTNWGQLLQAAMLGFTGLRTSADADPLRWRRYVAALPEGWDSVTLGRVYLAGRPCVVRAEHGRMAAVNCSEGAIEGGGRAGRPGRRRRRKRRV